MSDASAPAAPAPAQATAQVPAFSLTPATAYGGIIDYSTSAGRKLYASATAKVEEDLFDCTADDLYGFLRAVKDRAREFGWDQAGVGILSIPDDPANPTSFKSLLDQHGEITLQEIREFEETYIDQRNRSAQDTAQLYRCLMASLSKDGKKKILVWEDQYTINSLGSGNLLLKIIVRESHLDTNATSTSIRTKLTELDTYLPTIGHDITKFNTYVKLLVDGLRSRGETTTDLLTNLFKGYLSCSDRDFCDYITRKQDAWEEGTDIQPDRLMKQAADKYKTLLQKGLWNAPDKNEEKILALQSEIKKLKRKSTSKGKESATGKQPKPSWFDQRPNNADLRKSRKWNGKTWWYCHPDTGGKCEGKHRLHKPAECKGTSFKRSSTDQAAKKAKSGPRSKDNKLQLNRALQAAVATAEPDEYDSSASE